MVYTIFKFYFLWLFMTLICGFLWLLRVKNFKPNNFAAFFKKLTKCLLQQFRNFYQELTFGGCLRSFVRIVRHYNVSLLCTDRRVQKSLIIEKIAIFEKNEKFYCYFYSNSPSYHLTFLAKIKSFRKKIDFCLIVKINIHWKLRILFW